MFYQRQYFFSVTYSKRRSHYSFLIGSLSHVFILASLEDEQQYFADILIAIKQVMGAHLQEVQEKFQHRFEKLEEEVRNRDQIINQLQAHIMELERAAATDESFGVS